MPRILFSILFLILSSFAAWAQTPLYKVIRLNKAGDRAVVKGTLPARSYVSYEDEFAVTCTGQVLKSEKGESLVDLSRCSNNSAIRVGTAFQVDTAMTNEKYEQAVTASRADTTPSARESNRQQGPTANESWYTLWGIGIASIQYQDDETEQVTDDFDDLPGVDRSQYTSDLFGFYWPTADFTAMHGFIISTVSDSFDVDDDNSLTIGQVMLAYSYHRFFGANIGDGWFLRGDAGLSRIVLDSTIGTDSTKVSEVGLGLLGGGGYAWGIGTDTRLLLGGYLTHRRADDFTVNSALINLGFLF